MPGASLRSAQGQEAKQGGAGLVLPTQSSCSPAPTAGTVLLGDPGSAGFGAGLCTEAWAEGWTERGSVWG